MDLNYNKGGLSMFKHTGRTLQNIAAILITIAMAVGVITLVIMVIGLIVSQKLPDSIYLLYGLLIIPVGGGIVCLCLNGFGKIVEWYEEHETPDDEDYDEDKEDDEDLSPSVSNSKMSFAERVGLVQKVEEEETEEESAEQQANIETVYCKQCNHPVPENARFCPKCGAKQD